MDAVLCLQFDDHKVVSGSKDNTIKVMIQSLLSYDLIECMSLDMVSP